MSNPEKAPLESGKGGGARQKSTSIRSPEKSSRTQSAPSSSTETSPSRQKYLKFFTPKGLASTFKWKRSYSSGDKTSPIRHFSKRPILSSQCTGKCFESEISPIKPLRRGSDSSCSFSPGDSRFDFGSLDEDKIIPAFLNSRTCYDAMPKSGKVIVLSTDLLVKNAFNCLVTNEIRAAPLWDSSTHTFVGMLTISDFINVLRHYYYSSPETIKDIENQKIMYWRRITNVTKPVVKILPTDSLVSATKLLIPERIHRLLVFDDRRNSVLFVLTKKRLLQYLYNNLIDKFGKSIIKAPSFLKKTIGDLKSQLGTWENIATVTENTKVIKALDLFYEQNVSALPVMDEDNKLVDIFAKFDVFALAKEQTYDNLDMTVGEALDKVEVHEALYGCTLDEPLGTVIDKFVAVKVHRLVVLDERQSVIGMLSLSDVLKFLILQPLEESAVASDTIDEVPEGAVGGQDDSSVFLGSGTEPLESLHKSSSLEKQDSSDLSEDFVKLQLEADTPEPLSEPSICEDEP